MCSHDPIFGTNKNRILKNGSCERALKQGRSVWIFMICLIWQYDNACVGGIDEYRSIDLV